MINKNIITETPRPLYIRPINHQTSLNFHQQYLKKPPPFLAEAPYKKTGHGLFI